VRKLLAILAVAAVLASAAVFGATLASGSGGQRADAAATTVRVGDNFYSPSRKTISRGSLITFRWVGSGRHNVTTLTGKTLVSTRRSGSKSVRFFRSRTVICTIHPNSMRLRVTTN
jgi:plastocyanin